jgi:hypothetical protein
MYGHLRVYHLDGYVMAVGACWNVLAGHDYETIDRGGFPVRCFKINGRPEWKEANV